jgi:hypothetical protein
MAENIFAEGISFKKPREGAPEFIKGSISILADKLIPFIQEHKDENGWVNLDLKKSKEKGTLYLALNNYKKAPVIADLNPEEIPF